MYGLSFHPYCLPCGLLSGKRELNEFLYLNCLDEPVIKSYQLFPIAVFAQIFVCKVDCTLAKFRIGFPIKSIGF